MPKLYIDTVTSAECALLYLDGYAFEIYLLITSLLFWLNVPSYLLSQNVTP